MTLKSDSRRVTMVIEGPVDRKIREIQAKRIRTSQKAVSYSRVINDILKKKLRIE